MVRHLNDFLWPPAGRVILLALLLGSSPLRAAGPVVCHYRYGGETKQLVARPVASPYAVSGVQVGSYFRLRVVFQDRPADIAAIKVYTYADRNDRQVLIHQATFPYPPLQERSARYGFSGLHAVYEPLRGGELEYWCSLSSPRKPATGTAP